MKNAKRIKVVSLFAAALVGVSLLLTCCLIKAPSAQVSADTEVIYYDSVYGAPVGSSSTESYTIDCDYFEITANYAYDTAPAFGNTESSFSNYCGPVTGMDIVLFNDRWKTNLIPNYEPGFSLSDGSYDYWAMATSASSAAYANIYSLMKTGEVGGTTSTNFRNGLKSFVENAGYDISYSSIYSNSKTVNLNALKTAIDQNKVGVIMCSEYNYILSMGVSMGDTEMTIVKESSTIPHMMMVYGYFTCAYYKNGVNFQTDTYLYVTRSNGSGDLGYMQVNDDCLDIDEAYIVTIS